MIDITNDQPQIAPGTPRSPSYGPRPELSRKGFIITYPMFRYWGKESVEEGLAPKPLNLYVHTPYCIQRCAYCYFKTTTLKDNRLQEIDRYVSSVCKEIELISKHYDLKNRPIETVYFGGGTPTLLTEENIDKLFSTLRANFALGDAQITFEGEPVTLTERKAALLKQQQRQADQPRHPVVQGGGRLPDRPPRHRGADLQGDRARQGAPAPRSTST